MSFVALATSGPFGSEVAPSSCATARDCKTLPHCWHAPECTSPRSISPIPTAGVLTTDSGEVLDAAARDAYRRRLMELEEEASEADAAGDIGRSASIATERESLVEQLTAAYGLGGCARRVGSNAERARTAVTARMRDAIRRIATAHPELGQHLHRSVRTGTFCVYEPETAVRWHTQV
jgi:hypothetical protein